VLDNVAPALIESIVALIGDALPRGDLAPLILYSFRGACQGSPCVAENRT